MRQLVAVHGEKVDCNGGQGEIFSLQKQLTLPQPRNDGVDSMTMLKLLVPTTVCTTALLHCTCRTASFGVHSRMHLHSDPFRYLL